METYKLIEEARRLPVTIDEINEHLEESFSEVFIYYDNTNTNDYVLNVDLAEQETQSAYTTGQRISFKVDNTNTGNVTLNVDGLGVKKLFKPDGTTEIPANGLVKDKVYTCEYDSALDTGSGAFKLQSPNADEAEYFYIYNLVKQVTKYAEAHTKRDFITKTYKALFENFYYCDYYSYPNAYTSYPPSYYTYNYQIEIRKSQLQSVASFEYYDEDDVLQTFSSSNYYVSNDNDFSYLTLKKNKSWPTDINQFRPQPVEITFTAGYGDYPSDIPADLRGAILQHVARVFTNRGDCLAGNQSACSCSSAMNLPPETMMIYNAYKIYDMVI